MTFFRTALLWIKRNALWIALIAVLCVVFLSVRDISWSAHLRSTNIHLQSSATEMTVHIHHPTQLSGENHLHVIKSPLWDRFITDGEINDQSTEKPIVFLIDTGADRLVIPMSLARRIQLPLGKKILSQTANGISAGRECFVRSMTIGPFVISNVMAACKPGLDEISDQDHIVLIGMDVLHHFDIVIDGDLAILSLSENGQ